MITVQAHSRLHFGLFSLATESHWTNGEGQLVIPARRFGGVGLMVESPGVRLSVEKAENWSAEGPLAERALRFARLISETTFARPIWQYRIIVEACPPEHCGFGTGTQLALAVSRALCVDWFGTSQWTTPNTAEAFARMLGRGTRSALGIRGFMEGGFLIEGGKAGEDTRISPLLIRRDFPSAWRIVLVIPSHISGMHGSGERDAFDQLLRTPGGLATTDALCRLALLGMLPALVEQDCQAFGESLYDFNRRVGEMFAPVQGGPYSHLRVAELVEFIRKEDVPGVGQSSWGPTVFAVVPDVERASHLAATLRKRFGLTADEVICTAACNHGATVTGEPGA